jgi:hypothetical protein
MGKGSTQERIIFFILAVIFFGLVVFVIWKFFPTLITQIELALGIIKLSNVEKATLCSIYRCVEGCMSMKVQELSWKDETYENGIATCQDFCTGKPYGIGPELPDDAYEQQTTRICNSKYPVIIKLKEKEKIEKSHLVLGLEKISDVRCILPTDATGPNAWDIFRFTITQQWQNLANAWQAITGGTISENILIVDNQIVAGKGNKEDCVAAGTTLIISHDSLQQLTLDKEKTIKITTGFAQLPIVNVNFMLTYMAEKDKYEQIFGG